MQNTPILPLLPSTSFLSTFHSDLDYAPITEASIFKTVVTDNNLELSFEVDCTRVTIKTQTTSLTLPKDLWRTLGAARHHNLHLAEEKVNNSLLSLQTYFQTIERIRKEQGFHPLKDSKGIMFPYSRDINHYGVWWVEDMFSKHADSFSKNQKPSICPISKTLFFLRSRKLTMKRLNHLIKIFLSRTISVLQ